MGRKQRKRGIAQGKQPDVSGHSSRVPGWLFPFSVGVFLAGGLVFAAMSKERAQDQVVLNQQTPLPSPVSKLPSLGDLYSMSDEQLEALDIAVLNLRCAEGLPGAEKLDIQKCRRQLDEWAGKVRFETERHLYRVHDPRYADHYRNSEAYLRASMMLQVLQEDCGVHYNHDRIRDIDFTNSQDLFIHGIIGSENGGTCVSMPVLYTTIGRRLGYPIKLVLARQHVFCRWDGPKEKFNIEGSGEGFAAHEDEYYMKFPMPITKKEVRAGIYLRSLSPREELAVFLEARGYCLEDIGRFDESYVAYSMANHLAPKIPQYEDHLIMALRKQHQAKLMAAVGFRDSRQTVKRRPNYTQMYQPGFTQHNQPHQHQAAFRGVQNGNVFQDPYANPTGQQPAGQFPYHNSQLPAGFPQK